MSLPDKLADIEARRGDDTCPAHNSCLRSDLQTLIALVREQQARIDKTLALFDGYPDTPLHRNVLAALEPTP